ncbi:MAG: primosomal protein N' [Endomicrobiaceae bacterium]|nr:primosomal protein N' [Endomicrobiaceae bacterium]
MTVVKVVLPVPVNKSFHYSLPKDLENNEIVHRRVKVPFGNRVLIGYALSIVEEHEIDEKIKLKNIIEILDSSSILTEEIVNMAQWLSETYLCSIGEAFATIVPVSLKIPKRLTNPKTKKIKIENPDFQITKYQQKAFEEITACIKTNKNENFLLHGVTSSGKTEVYLRSIQCAIDNNKSAIFLLPEISLTPQFINILNTRFGSVVALWHSGVTTIKKYKIFHSIQTGEIKIVVGARSAAFLPFTNLGLIIIDEEHENTYKQNNKPSYDAKEIALWRGKYNNAVTVFGSATPSLETYKKCLDNDLKLLELPERVDSKPLPIIEMISLKDVKTKVSVFSKKMFNAIKKALARREQIIIFLNRRGFSPSIMCQKCDTVIHCPDCSIAMVYHKNPEHLKCHYCGKEIHFPTKCPKCNSKEFNIFGVGTQRIEEDLKKLFPHTKIFRLDGDTAKSKDIYAKVYEGIKNEEYSILLGTQMVAKGFDFPRVSLVCVVDADTSLYLPDFRSSERTFQLLTQVAGRCGRSKITGKVLVQTKYPDNYALLFAQEYNYKKFYEYEMKFRKDLRYPPFCNIAKLTIRNKDEKKALDFAQTISDFLDNQISATKCNIDLLGPSQSYISKLNGTYRWQIILKGTRKELKTLLEQVSTIKTPSETFINMELDPSDLL